MDLEGCADKVVHIVDLGAGHVRDGDRIDGNPRAILLDDEIVLVRAGHDFEIVAEARAAASRHAHAQCVLPRIFRHNFANAVGGALTHAYVRIVRHEYRSPLLNL